MPTLRFGKAIEIVRGVRIFLRLEVGATRGAIPGATLSKEQALQLKQNKQIINKQGKLLGRKEREITRLKLRLSSSGDESKQALGTTTPGGEASDGRFGTLPDFVIIGAQKAGTTYLYHLLAQHPHVEPATGKEVHYFDVNFDKGCDWYRSHFPRPARLEGRETLTGEASPYYMYHPHAARRAAGVIPQAKLIALLRNPVDRAYSDYQHKYREGREPLGSFEEAIEAEEQRLRGEREKMLADESYASPAYRRFSYLSRGVYVDQLKEWRRHFDEDQLLVLRSEDFFTRPEEIMTVVQEFLGLPLWKTNNLHEDAAARHKGTYKELHPDLRHNLETYFEPHNRRLYDYLGEDFGW